MGSPWFAWLNGDARIEREAVRWVMEMSNDPENTRHGLEQWLSGGPRRRRIYGEVAAEYARSAPAAALLQKRTDARGEKPPPRPVVSPWRTAALVTGLVAMIGAGIIALWIAARSPQREPASNAASSAGVKLSTSTGEMKRFRLADGSSIVLDGDTSLTIAFRQMRRDIILERGRARFDVAHDATRPFIVSAAGGTVTAVGTLFDVWIRPDHKVRVVLLRGAIEVKTPSPAKTADARPIALIAGQRLLYSVVAPIPSKDTRPVAASRAETAWMNETIDFDDVPLREILLEANRHSDLQIELADPRLGDTQVFGTFQIRDTARLARNLAQSLDLDLEQDGNRLILAARKLH